MPNIDPKNIQLPISSPLWQERITGWFDSQENRAWSPSDKLSAEGVPFQFDNTVLKISRTSKKTPGNDLVSFKLSEYSLIGEGAFGKVYTVDGIYRPDYPLKKLVAKNKDKVVKVIKMNINDVDLHNPDPYSDNKKDIMREYRVCVQAGHMGIKEPVFKNNTCYIVMNRIKGQSLKNLINDGTIENLTLNDKRILSYKLLLALKKQVIDKGLYHRDLKPDNILVSLDDPIEVNIIDYGLGRFVAEEDNLTKGNKLYTSPEHLYQMPLNVKSEVFTMGRIIARLWTSDLSLYKDSLLPKFDSSTAQARHFAQNASSKLSIPDNLEIEALLKKMMSMSVDTRVTIDEAIDEFEKKVLPEISMSTDKSEETARAKDSNSSFTLNLLSALTTLKDYGIWLAYTIAACFVKMIVTCKEYMISGLRKGLCFFCNDEGNDMPKMSDSLKFNQ